MARPGFDNFSDNNSGGVLKMSMKITIRHWWQQVRSGHAYVNLITRSNDGNGNYFERVDFILRSELPSRALNIQNYGKYWYYLDNVQPGTDQTPKAEEMTAGDVCTWADNNDINRALMDLWSWTNNLDWKKIAIVGGVVMVAILLFTMIR